MLIKSIFKRIATIYHNRSLESKRQYLISQGAKIGEKTRLHCRISAFGSEPYLIEIGRDCAFAEGVMLITHDGGVKVLNSLGYFDGKRHDRMARITIGDNVYLGADAMVMPGVHIGDNCIIGARAVVTRDIPANSVAVGMPARVVRDLDAYYQKTMEQGGFYPTGGMPPAEKRAYLEKNVKR